MPVIADSDEPPAKCCKYCEESTHGVDGPASWRLTLDQDLIDTLKGSFPSWFQQTNATTNTTVVSTTGSKLLTAAGTHNNIANHINRFKVHQHHHSNSNSHNNGTITINNHSSSNGHRYGHHNHLYHNHRHNNGSSNSISSNNINVKSNTINGVTITTTTHNGINLLNNTICVTPITIDTTSGYIHHTTPATTAAGHNFLSQQNTLHLHQLNGVAANKILSAATVSASSGSSLSSSPSLSSSSASPASSVTSNCSGNTHSTISSKNSSNSSSASASSSLTSSGQTKKLSNIENSSKTHVKTHKTPSATIQNCANIQVTSTATIAKSLPTTNSVSVTTTQGLKTNNKSSFATQIASATTTTTTAKIASTSAAPLLPIHIPSAVGATTITRVIPKSPSLHSLSGGTLLATFSSPGSATTFELVSDSSCNGLLTASHLSGKSAFEQTFQDVILLQEAYDDMSEGEQRLNASFLGGISSSDDATNSDFYDPRQSPPKAIVDSSPLQPQMDKNKESLKVKLMVRRPHSQLVEQGIIPPLKTSPAIHEQCKQLERAKTSDLLKAKIQQRPNREDLERRHILEEDECHIDPSLAEKQRMLKKARLADQLNSQIQHRPGPLELIKKNILHTEKPIEKIVKEGLVTFKATSEGLLTRPQHPNSYITYDDDSQQSSESDTRQTPPRVEGAEGATSISTSTADTGVSASAAGHVDVLQNAAASAGIVTVALTIPTSGGQITVTSAPLMQSKVNSNKVNYIPPPPPPPLPNNNNSGGITVKQETSNLFEELCQSVTGSAGTNTTNNHYIPMMSSPASLGSTTSTLSPLSSIASPPLSLTPRPLVQSPALQIAKSDAPGKDKNRKKSKSKPVSKARTIKFHEYKGPPSAAHKLTSETTSSTSSTEETSYQLMLEQQNCLLKFLETLNKNQAIIPATSSAGSGNSSTPVTTTVMSANKTSTNLTSNTISSSATNTSSTMSVTVTNKNNTPTPMQIGSSDVGVGSNLVSVPSSMASTISIVAAPQPPPMPSPAPSVGSSIPPSPATSYAESSTSSTITDITKLEKMKVCDLKIHLKKRNLPVSGPKPQLIERLKPYLPLEPLESTVTPMATSDSSTAAGSSAAGDAMDQSENNSPRPPLAMSPERQQHLDQEQMDVVQQVESPRPVPLQTVMQPQPQTATIILTNEELLREQQRKIDELQRQLQRSQQELLEIRQKQQQQQQQPPHHHMIQQKLLNPTSSFQQQQQTVTAQVVNALPTQQITLITTTTTKPPATAPQTLAVIQPHSIKETLVPAKLTVKTSPIAPPSTKSTAVAASGPMAANKKPNISSSSPAVTTTTSTIQPVMTQKMVVKQQLEAKIQKQKQAAAAAAAAQAQAQAQAQVQAQAKALAQVQAQAQALAQAQAQAQLRLLTQKTQTVLIPTGPTTITATTTGLPKMEDKLANCKMMVATKNHSNIIKGPTAPSGSNATTTIVANQLPLTKTHNNLGLVWNEGNQTIFLVGLNDQHMTAHTIGNISLANASPATKKLINGHQRTNSLPSIVFPINTGLTQAVGPTMLNATSPAVGAGQQQVVGQPQLHAAKAMASKPQLQKMSTRQQLQMHQHANPVTIQPSSQPSQTTTPTAICGSQQQQQQHIIQLDIKPQNLQPPPPPPPPPPQYEEATKHLKTKQQEQGNSLLDPAMKIKEEPNNVANQIILSPLVNNQQLQGDQKPLKATIKSEKLADVLDILFKQGESNVGEPITPVTTPLTPGGTNALMNGALMFSKASSLEDNKANIKLENIGDTMKEFKPQMEEPMIVNDKQMESEQQKQQQDLNKTMAMDCGDSQMVSDHSNNGNNQNATNATTTDGNSKNSIFNFYSKSPGIIGNGDQNNQCSSSNTMVVGNNNNHFIENIDMTSPIQPDCHIDAESVAKTLDIFLDSHHHHHHQQQQHSQNHTTQHNQSPTHHDMLSKTCLESQRSNSSNMHSGSTTSQEEAKLNHFDEFELLELMSQQLEMDIGEDTNTNFNTSSAMSSSVAHTNGSNEKGHNTIFNSHNRQSHHNPLQQLNHAVDHERQHHPHQQQHSNEKLNILNGLGREMNSPSLQSSLEDIMQNHNNLHLDGNPRSCNSDALTNALLDDFDTDSFVRHLTQQHHHQSHLNPQMQQQQQHHGQDYQQQLNHHGDNNNTNLLHHHHHHHLDNTTEATPMDCDDFDSPLSGFNFSALSPDSNINTPPHPFGMNGNATPPRSSPPQVSTTSGPNQLNGLGNNSSITCGLQATSSTTSSLSSLSNGNLNYQPQCSGQINTMFHNSNMHGISSTNANDLGGGGGGGDMGSSTNGDAPTTANDNVGSTSADIFDLFNIDDYKMSWGEGDFAV
ncbi:myocardin-related transcription factor [Haematobia irritans]|uniref:myocardin-related transcription factor n=1 Tax=Haematobia irritans TaxID=7368 RepID=UPI003F50AC01